MEDQVSSENEYDSDKELQVALKQGLIKGLVSESIESEKEIYNTAGLTAALNRLKNSLPWIERMDLTVDPIPPPKVILDELGENPDDLEGLDDTYNGFKRESKFYRLAQAAVREGLVKLHAMNIETKRPNDYFAEMAKSDEHMKKIRSKLQSVQLQKERSEKAKKLRELRKFGKKVQQEVLEKKQKEKKEMLDAVKKYRKGQASSLEDILQDKRNTKQHTTGKPNAPNKKRELRNKKFGFGGQKKRSKYNTKDSTNDVDSSFKSFRSSKNFGKSKGNEGGHPAKNNKNKKRPGKQRRQNSRNRK